MPQGQPPFASLYAFLSVAETGGLAATAERLNVTQPAVSKRVRELEAHLGVTLIQRGANSIILTDIGRQYAAKLALGFSAIRTATEELGASALSPLRVKAHNTWALRWLIPRLPRFRAAHPGQEVEVTTPAHALDFSRDPGDITIRVAEHAPTPDAEQLEAVTIAPFAVPSLARHIRQTNWRDVTLLGSCQRPNDWAAWSASTGVDLPCRPLLFETTILAIQAALEGLGAVIVSPSLVTKDVRSRRLTRMANSDVSVNSFYWLLFPSRTPRPAALAFRSWLLEEIASSEAPRTRTGT